MTKKVEAVQFEFECRFEAEVVKGDLHHHQVIPTDPIHSPGRQKASRRYTQYLDITCLLKNLKAVPYFDFLPPWFFHLTMIHGRGHIPRI